MLLSAQSDFRELRNAFRCFASGVTVVTLRDGAGRPTGVTVSSFASLSLAPALCMFSLGRRQPSCRWIEANEGFIVNVLARGQDDVAWQFARPIKDKFAGIDQREGGNGMPVIAGCLGYFECRKWATYDGGDHLIVVGEITDFVSREGEPLVFFGGRMSAVAP